MTMDPNMMGVNGVSLENQSVPLLSDPSYVAVPRFEDNYLGRGGIRYVVPPKPSPLQSGLVQEEDSPEDFDFSDAVLKYISQMLMEEDMEEKTCMLQESLDLQAAEKSFYEAIGQKYPPSPRPNPCNHGTGESLDGCLSGDTTSSCLIANPRVHNSGDYDFFPPGKAFPTCSASHSLCSSSNSGISSADGLVDSPISVHQVPNFGSESELVWQFMKGVEEASKFLPNRNGLLENVDFNGFSPHGPHISHLDVVVKAESRDESEGSPCSGSRGRKNPYREDGEVEEERSSKQAAVFSESTLRSEMFDIVLLCNCTQGRNHVTILREALKNGSSAIMMQNGKSNGLTSGRGRGKKQRGKKDVVDLRTLLLTCAQAVALDDRTNVNELLRQIRQHASPFGDGNQRLACCLADGLEARLAGTGSQIYKGLISKRTSAADILKAYHLFLAACPFRKISNFVSNRTIMNIAADSMRIHIIDFGILYGFQWPTLIQRLSSRPDGPPKLRITGIDFPQPGFRPAERVEETGRRLKAYAESFNVPFEYNAIAKKWENIQIEELKIEKDEILIVNCIYRSKNLLDETVVVDSPRNMVNNMIRKINPDIFIHGIVNGSYNAPFFVTRFREALFHFSALFDMLETVVPRENPERMLIEKEIFGREALNVIACESWERVERPETYKQWQVRNLRAGFVQLPFHREIIKKATNKVRLSYHKDFMIDEDSRWLLQGWKGRIIYALSCWKPAYQIEEAKISTNSRP